MYVVSNASRNSSRSVSVSESNSRRTYLHRKGVTDKQCERRQARGKTRVSNAYLAHRSVVNVRPGGWLASHDSATLSANRPTPATVACTAEPAYVSGDGKALPEMVHAYVHAASALVTVNVCVLYGSTKTAAFKNGYARTLFFASP